MIHMFKKEKVDYVMHPQSRVSIAGITACGAGKGRSVMASSIDEDVTCPTCRAYWRALESEERAFYLVRCRSAYAKQQELKKLSKSLKNGTHEYLGWTLESVQLSHPRVRATKGEEMIEAPLDGYDLGPIKAKIKEAEFKRLYGESLEDHLKKKVS